jgi:hypothetical protein
MRLCYARTFDEEDRQESEGWWVGWGDDEKQRWRLDGETAFRSFCRAVQNFCGPGPAERRLASEAAERELLANGHGVAEMVDQGPDGTELRAMSRRG